MKAQLIWEHNGNDTLLYCGSVPGAYARGASLEEALGKMPAELRSFTSWVGDEYAAAPELEIVQEKVSSLDICDADSDVIFDTEREGLTKAEYEALKSLAVKSAQAFLALYASVPCKDIAIAPERKTFYGVIPHTAEEMYQHTKNVNSYYFREVGVDADNAGTIVECRERGFALLESRPDFLDPRVFDGSYGEQWSVRKVLRRFIWHDRIHAKAMYRQAVKTFGAEKIVDSFGF